MSEENQPVGSLAEEAVKLLGALQGWAKENAQDATSKAAGASAVFTDVNEHIATGGQNCKYCPVCQLITAVRGVSPEVTQHLNSAARSLLKAATAARPTGGANSAPGEREPSVEHIALDDWPHE
jgi:hypothetical protein